MPAYLFLNDAETKTILLYSSFLSLRNPHHSPVAMLVSGVQCWRYQGNVVADLEVSLYLHRYMLQAWDFSLGLHSFPPYSAGMLLGRIFTASGAVSNCAMLIIVLYVYVEDI